LLSATTFAWLRKIARCKIADINRRDRGDKRSVAREVGLTDQHDDQFSLMALDKSPSDRVIEKEELKLTLEAIEKLDSREQKIVSMKYQLQMTNTEIADHYGMTASDLGVKLFRILAKIRKQLGAESDGIKR
jgi:RNA polymerase sigma factor (sigma-70 family)